MPQGLTAAEHLHTGSATSGGMTAGGMYADVLLADDLGPQTAVANPDAGSINISQQYPAAQGGLLPPHHRVRC